MLIDSLSKGTVYGEPDLYWGYFGGLLVEKMLKFQNFTIKADLEFFIEIKVRCLITLASKEEDQGRLISYFMY